MTVADWVKKLVVDLEDRPGKPRPFANIPAVAAALRKDAAAALLRTRPGAHSPHSNPPVPDDPSVPVGAALADLRRQTGLSQRDLEVRSGLSRGLIADIERGRRDYLPTRRKLHAVLLAAMEERAA